MLLFSLVPDDANDSHRLLVPPDQTSRKNANSPVEDIAKRVPVARDVMREDVEYPNF